MWKNVSFDLMKTIEREILNVKYNMYQLSSGVYALAESPQGGMCKAVWFMDPNRSEFEQ